MGMAASQARYLALTARKTNVEYEGQQINQSRLMLANQSADLFNQMLGMEVPTAPSSADFTTNQYSFSDGINDSVLENYYQIGIPDEEYNYVVTTYHYEDIYTGSKKLLTDPQIQATKTDRYSYDPTKNNKLINVASIIKPSGGNTSYTITDGSGQTFVFKPVDNTITDERNKINALSGRKVPSADFAYDDVNDEYTENGTTYTKVDTTDATQETNLKKVYGDDYNKQDNFYVDGAGNYISGFEVQNAISTLDPAHKNVTVANANKIYYKDNKGHYALDTDLTAATAGSKLKVQTVTYDPIFSGYKAVGNSKLTTVTVDDYKDDETISTEIKQIIKDMNGPNGSTSAAENFANCFDADGDYIGGIYSFELSGTTYYTTEFDLNKSLASAYEKPISDNGIDGQQSKLSYYNATYLSTKVEETKKALLETDGAGRFKTARFEDDSVVYDLNFETITDDEAYNDAMNKYYYEQDVYDKSINDINAKTETLQTQDRTLELRLEQLNTEQSALQNEMDAVKKVVDKHVEQGFKTFGG